MTFVRRAARVLTTPAMIAPYWRWCYAAARGHGPYAPGVEGGRVSVRWVSFSEYWSYRNGIETAERALIRRCLRRGTGAPSVAMDVGANLGLFTVEMAALGFEVHSFEPAAGTYARLKQNVEASGFQNQVRLNKTAVADRNGEGVFCVEGRSPGTNHLVAAKSAASPDLTAVPLTTVDSYMAERGLASIDIMKVDVEGFEAAVFRGASEALRGRAIQAILFEVSPPLLKRAGESTASLYATLRASGYGVYALAAGGGRGEELAPAAMDLVNYANLLAEPR